MDPRPTIDHELLLAQAGWVRGLAGSLVRDPGGAEDLAQETLLAALARPPLLAGDERSLRAWLSSVVTNLSRLAVRGSARRRGREELAARPERVPSASETVERASQLKLLVDEVLSLEEPYRSTILLRFFEGLDASEIGARTGATAPAVRKRLSRGLERLRQRLDERTEGDRAAWHAALAPLLAFAPRTVPLVPVPSSTLALCTSGKAAGWVAALALSGLTVWVAAMSVEADLTKLATRAESAPAAPGEVPAAKGAGLGREAAAPTKRSELPAGPDDDSARVPMRSELRVVELTPGPAPASRPSSEQVFRARVVGLDGIALPGVAVRSGAGAPLGVSSWDGGLERTLALERALWLEVEAEGLATLRSGSWTSSPSAAGSRDPEHPALVVAAPSVAVGGVVVDGRGAPVEGAEVALEVPDEAWLDFPLPLRSSRAVDYRTRTDACGVFRFDSLPTHPALRLWASSAAHGSVRVAVPEFARLDLRVTLGAAPLAGPAALEGRVAFADGSPVEGAIVRAGESRARTDASGRYRLPLDPLAEPGARPLFVVAELEGWLPAARSLELALASAAGAGTGPSAGQAAGSGEGPGWNDSGGPLGTLEIPGPLLAIAGQALTPLGTPAGGCEVLAVVESSDPRRPRERPGSVAARARADEHGRFELVGLLDRPYGVVALDRVHGFVAGPVRLTGGQRATLRVQGPGALSSGRVTAPSGAPRPGVLLGWALPTEAGPIALGTPVASGPDGSFQLGDPPLGGGLMLVASGSSGALEVAFQSQIGLAESAFLVYAGRGLSPRPEALAALDVDGWPLVLETPAGRSERLRLAGGRSPVIELAEHARTLVLYAGGVELARLPIQLAAGEVTVVRGLAGGITAGQAGSGVASGPGGPGALPSGAQAGTGGTGGGSKNSQLSVTGSGARQP